MTARRRSAALVILALLLVAPLVAWARPGGGQSYRAAPSRTAPSHSYSAPSHSYTPPSHTYVPSAPYAGSGYATTTTTASSADEPRRRSLAGPIIVALFILVVVIVVMRSRRPARASVMGDRAEQGQGLAALMAHDPAFDGAAFARRVAQVMALVNDAWCAGTMGPARRFISDGVYVRFQTQLRLLKAAGKRNAMADWKLLGGEILAAESDALWDTVHVKVTAEARDADVPAQLTAQQAADKARSAPVRRYEEVWSFLRRRGQKSKAGVPVLEGQCPNCGAPLPIGDTVRCASCKALVNSGEHDWVLAEITQPEEWQPFGAQAAEIAGLDELRQKDATVSRQELEDRASMIFWRYVEALVTGKRQPLERFCLVPGAPPLPPAQRLTDVVVGAAETVAAAVGDDGLDRVIVDVTWSAGVGGSEPENQISRVTLARAATATSKRGLSALDCPNCGGPLADSDLVKCNYCSEPLAGGKHEWALESVG